VIRTAKTALATLAQLQLQLQRQVMPAQAHLHVQCASARAAAAASSDQLEAGSAVHAIVQHVVILFPASRSCGAALTLGLSCSVGLELLPAALMHMVTMCTA
jgi:hypothetical protein